MGNDNDHEVETSQVDGTWVVRLGSTVLHRHTGRHQAIEAGVAVATLLGVPHVVRYAASPSRHLVPA